MEIYICCIRTAVGLVVVRDDGCHKTLLPDYVSGGTSGQAIDCGTNVEEGNKA